MLRALCSLLVLVALPAAAQTPQAWGQPPFLAAEATAEVQVPPDRAVVRFGVQHQHKEAREAQRRANEAMNQVMRALRGRNIPAERIGTERLELHPVYDHRHDPMDGRYEGPRLIGFRASNVVRVVLPVEAGRGAQVGEVIDAAIGAGANTVEGISFELADVQPHHLRALRLASEQARARVAALAEALGVGVGRLLVANEGAADFVPPPTPFVTMERKAMADSTPVSPGELTVRATVQVRYEVQQR